MLMKKWCIFLYIFFNCAVNCLAMELPSSVLLKAQKALEEKWMYRSSLSSFRLRERLREVTRIEENASEYSRITGDYSCMINLSMVVSSAYSVSSSHPIDTHSNSYFDFYFPIWGSCQTQKSFHVHCSLHYDCTASRSPKGAACQLLSD